MEIPLDMNGLEVFGLIFILILALSVVLALSTYIVIIVKVISEVLTQQP